MAKQDFCFTYYDGDAARDKAHMTRLCRGAYDDLISMQRKVGHMSLETIKMVLSSDFDACWASLKFILKTDSEGLFFIEWVENSIKKMQEKSQKQTKKITEYWERRKGLEYTLEQKNNTIVSKNQILEEPIIENENGNGYVIEEKGGMGEKTNLNLNFIYPSQNEIDNMELPENEIENCTMIIDNRKRIYNISHVPGSTMPPETILLWQNFKITNFTGDKPYSSKNSIIQHFKNFLNTQKFYATNRGYNGNKSSEFAKNDQHIGDNIASLANYLSKTSS